MKTFPRMMTAMITPFKENGEVDYNGAQYLAKYLLQNGSKGIVVSGTTGESPTITIQEKLDLFKAVKEAVGNEGTVIAGTGSYSTADSIKLTEQASKLSIEGILSVTPYYNKPNQEGLYQHFSAIAASTDLPIILYNVPGRTGINLLPDTVARLATKKNIVALKEACGNTDQVSALKNLVSDDFIIYSGDDSMTLPMLAVGAYGVISVASHVAPRAINEMIEYFFSGNTYESARMHNKLYPLFKAMFVTTNPIPVKKALDLLGLPSGKPRLPLVEASPSETETIKKALAGFGLL